MTATDTRRLRPGLPVAVAVMVLMSAFLAGLKAPSHAAAAETPFDRVYQAEDAVATIGNVHDSWTEGDQPAGLSQPLTGYSGKGFLDFSDPVPSTDYHGTIPASHDGAMWNIQVPRTGIYRLRFVYNNPATKWGGSRNARDERDMRVTVNGSSYTNSSCPTCTSTQGWMGWMIFNVSGYNDTAQPGAVQSYDTVGQNTKWNNNYIYVPFHAGDNTLRLSVEAPPGQAIYDGPNLDSIEVTAADDQFVPRSEVPRMTGAFQHPGIDLTSTRLAAIKQAKDIPGSIWQTGYQQLVASPLSSSSYQRSDGYYATVDRGPYNNPDIGANAFLNDGTAVFYNALRWYLDGDSSHAKKAIEILNGWSSTLQQVIGNDAKLIVGLAGPQYLNGAEIIKYLYNTDPSVPAADKWSTQDMARFDTMVRHVFYDGTIRDFLPQANGNWDTNISAANLAIGVYLNDHAIFNRGLEQFYRGDALPSTLSWGSLPSYIYPTGEGQESSRDQAHAQLGLSGLAFTSEIAWNQGINVFGAYNDRLLAGAEYYGRYALGESVPSQTFISDKSRGAPSTSGGSASNLLEILADHAAAAGMHPGDMSLINQVLNEVFRTGDNWISTLIFRTPNDSP